jgi:tetraacyldisaccharide 4'-kinase
MNSVLPQRIIGTDENVGLFLLRLIGLPFALLYYVAVTARNALYDMRLLRDARVRAPVISVGNLTVGGTGKTPLVIALANRAVAAGKKVAIVARGYGAVADEHGRPDEVALMASRCPGAMVVVVPDKLMGARQAVAQGAELVIVDDGMQHRRLHRDLEIVLIDARAPFGSGMVLPVGALREPASGVARADVLVLTHGEMLSSPERESVESRVRSYQRDVPLVWAHHAAVGVRPVGGGLLQPPATLSGHDVFLFCGIASPEGFRQTVEGLGAHVTGLMGFPDHHAFTGRDLASVRAAARSSAILCTEKDAAKVAAIPGNDDLQCLVIDLHLHGRLPPIPGLDVPWSPPQAPQDEGHGHAAPHGSSAHH